jgi:3-methyladenine DNA glycosylase AlkC
MNIGDLVGKNWSAIRQAGRAYLDTAPPDAFEWAVFAKNPQLAIDLLGILKDVLSRYVQESAGNALRDMGRKHSELVLSALRAWVAEAPGSEPRKRIAKVAF